MRKGMWVGRAGLGLALGAGALLAAGCSHPASFEEYLSHRGADAAQMLDIGATQSREARWSVYACLLGLSSIGAGHVEGEFSALGGGHAGSFNHYHKVCGLLLWTYEELGWDAFDVKKPETLYRWHTGPIGYAAYPERKPAYTFA